MDHCGLSGVNESDTQLYGQMSRALNATGRPITFSLCQWSESSVWKWGAQLGQMYRVQMEYVAKLELSAGRSG